MTDYCYERIKAAEFFQKFVIINHQLNLYATWSARNPSTLTRPLTQLIIARVKDFQKWLVQEENSQFPYFYAK